MNSLSSPFFVLDPIVISSYDSSEFPGPQGLRRTFSLAQGRGPGYIIVGDFVTTSLPFRYHQGFPVISLNYTFLENIRQLATLACLALLDGFLSAYAYVERGTNDQ